MATVEDIATLRRLINEPEDVAPYTQTDIGIRLDLAGGVIRTVAAEIWTEKAAQFAELVDVQEGSSRRSLGDLHEQAIVMAGQLGADNLTNPFRAARTRQIERT